MKIYNLKDTLPYKKLKDEYLVFELSTDNEFYQAINDYEGAVYIEETKSYLITNDRKCFVLFYKNKKEIERMLKDKLNGGNNYDSNKHICDE